MSPAEQDVLDRPHLGDGSHGNSIRPEHRIAAAALVREGLLWLMGERQGFDRPTLARVDEVQS